LWANRLQDWQFSNERIECIAKPQAGQSLLRTVGVLTRQLLGDSRAQLRVRTGTLTAGAGFSGFLIGGGADAVDYRAAALTQGASGIGGGLLATYEADGTARFRDHTAETSQFAYAQLAAGTAGPARTTTEDVELRLDITPSGETVTLTLGAYNAQSGALLSIVTLDGVDPAAVRGGIALASSDQTATPGARFWFASLQATGPGVAAYPDRGLGPIVGTLFTVSGSVLKMTVQLVPIAASDPQEVWLEIRNGTGPWRKVATATVQEGYAALLRVNDWDASREWEYRVIYPSSPRAEYAGRVPAEPVGRPLVIGTINCVKATHRSLNQASDAGPNIPGEHELGLFTARNLYFPYTGVASNLAAQRPDLLVALGDQYYENSPTSKDTSSDSPTLDYFYKYLLWLWAFGDLTRQIPTVVMVDDHDMYQGNIWGWSGAPANGGDFNFGGYAESPDWVNMVQRVQCAHNPDPYDPTPVLQGITVYYTAFAYGGVSFAVLEDRKFKNTDATDTDRSGNTLPPDTLELLGPRQEAFLAAWKDMHPGLPKVVFTQTTWACLQTNPDGTPTRDYDSNGFPVTGRLKAIQLAKDAGAVILSGDQHLAAVIHHGINDFTDGPVQFASPAGSSSFQRWFEPAKPLPDGNGQPYTGDFTDGFGNKLRVLAVANPKVSFAEYRQYYPTGQGLGDQTLKSEGYGIVRVDPQAAEFTFECWPLQVDPTQPGAQQFPGWPIRVPFSATSSTTA
jgi:alkaline phosphatase D